MFGSMFETAAYHRGLQWPPTGPSPCGGGYTMPVAFDATSTSRLSGGGSAVQDVPHGHVAQSTAGGYSGLIGHHSRYTGGAPGPLYGGRSAVRDALFGCDRFSDASGGGSSTIQTSVNDDSRQPSSAATFSPLSLPCVGGLHDGATTSTGPVADCPPAPAPRLPAAPYRYGGPTTGDDRFYGGSGGASSGAFAADLQSAGCASQPTTGFRSPSFGLGFSTRRFVNDVIGEYSNIVIFFEVF